MSTHPITAPTLPEHAPRAPRTSAWRTVHAGAMIAAADFRAMYTWTTWTFGWLARMLSQAVFFALVGKVFSSPGGERYLFVGNALMACAIEAMLVITSSAWERRSATLPLLVASPAELAWVFVGRSLQWIPSGIATSTTTLLVLGPFFGVHWTVPGAAAMVCLVALTAVGTYCFGLFLSALALSATTWRNTISNVAYLGMMAICGVEVPVSVWPTAVRWVAWSLPLTHDLLALRGVLDGAPVGTVLLRVLLGTATALAWLALALPAFGRVAASGRRSGTLESTG
ncbi:ABC transporter permease [Kitasatospora sp. NPDC001683]